MYVPMTYGLYRGSEDVLKILPSRWWKWKQVHSHNNMTEGFKVEHFYTYLVNSCRQVYIKSWTTLWSSMSVLLTLGFHPDNFLCVYAVTTLYKQLLCIYMFIYTTTKNKQQFNRIWLNLQHTQISLCCKGTRVTCMKIEVLLVKKNNTTAWSSLITYICLSDWE